MDRTVNPFSAGYFMIDAEIEEHPGDNVIVPHDFYDELRNFVTAPLLRISEEHYWTHPEWGVPAKTVAVPEEVEHRENDPVLMAKNNTAFRLVTAGEQPEPS